MKLDRGKLIEIYKTMLTIRLFEEKVYYLFLQGIMPGTIHQYVGEEAVAVGVCSQLNKDDFITSTHRPHGHAVAKGVSLKAMMAELFAKETGCCKGRGGSMHVGDPDVGMLPANAIVGGGIPIAVGLGLSYKLTKTKRVAVSFFGEGASNEGAFHEGLNFAAVQDLPVIFVCENNQYASSTPISLACRLEDLAERASAYGIPGVKVDGNDVLAVYEVAWKAIDRARSGKGPTLIECKTYRLWGQSRSDPAHYRPKEEVEAWKRKDPLLRFKELLLKESLVSEMDLEIMREEVAGLIEEAVEYAQNSPSPQPASSLEDVFA